VMPDLALVEPNYVYDLMTRARLMVAKCGTSVQECMLLGVPVITCYKVHPAMAWVAKHIMRFSMPYFSLPNLLAGKPVVPELIQEDCNHRRIVDIAGSLFYEERERQAMLDAFHELRSLVCRPNPLRRVAELVSELLRR